MKKIVLLVFLSLLSFLCFAQKTQSRADSILNLIKKHPQKDTTKVNLLNEYFSLKLYENPDSTIIKYVEEALLISQKISYQAGTAFSLQRIGIAYQYLLNDQKKAIDYYHKSIAETARITDEKLKKKINNSNNGNIANIYLDMGDYKNSIATYQKIITTIKSEKTVFLAQVYGNIGISYNYLENYNKAIYYFKLSIEVAKQLKATTIEANSLSSLSNCLAKTGKIKEAVIALEKSLVLVETNNLDFIKMSVYLNAGLIYRLKKDFSKAEIYAKKGVEIAKKINHLVSERAAHLTLFEVYEDQHKYKEALASYKNYTILKDSIENTEKQTEINRKIIHFEAEKKQAIANEEIEYQKSLKNYSIIGLITLLFAATGIFIFYKKHRDSIQKQNELLYKVKVADTEMRILRLQMNPHFIFNSLNSISDYISKNDIQNADYYLSKFAKLMRGILENSEEKEIPLADELKMLELYMQLEGSRLNNKFTYEIKVSEDVDANVTMVPPLILQPFVENSIWHGFADKDGGGKIIIEVTHDNSLLNCVVEDNGVGRMGTKPSSGKSYGMKITKDRIELLNKLKNTNASVNLIDLAEGTRVEVKLPFETEA